MLRAVRVTREGEPSGSVVLDYDLRHRRRVRLTTEDGADVLLDLPEARLLREGDRLVLEDGRLILVRAADEAVMEAAAGDPVRLARLAWHLGNRHAPVQVLPGALRFRHDTVLAEMLRGLGATVVDAEAPFDPEVGAYARGHAHAHSEGPDTRAHHPHDTAAIGSHG